MFFYNKEIKKGKYVAAFDYLESVEKYNFIALKRREKRKNINRRSNCWESRSEF